MLHEGNQPRIIYRQCGGWLAVSPRGARLKIGVTGETEHDARSRFDAALLEWRDLLGQRDPEGPLG